MPVLILGVVSDLVSLEHAEAEGNESLFQTNAARIMQDLIRHLPQVIRSLDPGEDELKRPKAGSTRLADPNGRNCDPRPRAPREAGSDRRRAECVHTNHWMYPLRASAWPSNRF